MVCSSPTNSRLLALALACLLNSLAVAQAGAAAEDIKRSSQNISLDAASSDVDYKTNTVVFKDVVISQGDIRVQAQHAKATGLNFDNTRWTFDGDVRIRVEQRGSLRSDQAVVDFQNNQISKATITGKPAEFEQKRADSDVMAHGRAGEIVYEVNAGTIMLSNDAWLSDGRNEISGPQLVYNIRKESVQAETKPGGSERVRITITPAGKPQVEKDTPASPAPKNSAQAGAAPRVP